MRDDLDNEIRKYKLDALLLLFADKSREMFYAGKAFEKVRLTPAFEQILPVWGLAELSYRAIRNSNDYRAHDPKSADVLKLNNLLAKVTDEKAGCSLSGGDEDQAKATVFVGLPQTQMWWQDMARNRAGIVYHFLRQFLLLAEMPKSFPELKSPDVDLKKITGFGIEDFSRLLFSCYVWILSAPSSEISMLKNVDKKITDYCPIVTMSNINKCIGYFTGDYRYYRNDSHLNNPLFFRPIIQTDTKRLIVSNTFLLAKKFYEGIYWIIRDKYMTGNSQSFVNACGRYYEKYIETLLAYYLKPETYRKISDAEGGADWIIDTGKYCIIVEQKSSLMSIRLKAEYPPIKEIREYLKSFNEACAQLRKTGKNLTQEKRSVIKLILHSEKLYFKEPFFKPQLLKLSGNHTDRLKRYYLIDT
ncbi:hypothetical protein ACFL3N_01570, partial [Candidatus Omnitrophota bacterium]